ncbi:MAG: HAD-IA family hydrolase [Spirochaetia bacterium]|nr:HAD-IA family hydrolase [Spirochaetia bacterium]
MKTKIFIGSSKESLPLARAVMEHLESDFEVTIWKDGAFEIAKYTMDSILKILDTFEFGIFIFAKDDMAKIRNKKYIIVRDNVLFEFGLFIGRSGMDKSLIIHSKDVHLPSDLEGIYHANFDSDRTDQNYVAAMSTPCRKIKKHIKIIVDNKGSEDSTDKTNIRKRTEFTNFLQRGLSDKNIKKISMVTYTAEVNIGFFKKYFIQGEEKQINIYKRSILEDLAEQQEWNLRNLINGKKVDRWRKRKNSIESSKQIEEVSKELKVKINQIFYNSSPNRRIYLLDNKEAIVAYYQVIDDQKNPKNGSIYKGINDCPAIYINNLSQDGKYFLEEIYNYLKGLERSERTWADEDAILHRDAPWKGSGKIPCIAPKAVFFDVDGLLIDSLENYYKAWKIAFKSENIKFTKKETYLEEGRSGVDTIRKKLIETGREVNEDLIKRIHLRRKIEYKKLGKAVLMDGALDLVKTVANSGLKIFAVTGSSDDQLKDRLYNDFDGLIKKENIITSKDTWAGKPHPSLFLYAASKANIHPHNAIVIENAPLGIKAANSAGMFCLCINTGILDNKLLIESGSKAVFNNCRDLEKNWADIITILTE